jgi:thiosulfate/3-mercaptopyruvate sulfurtransferase
MNTSMIRWIATAALSVTALAAQAGLLPGPIVETTWLAANASQVQVVEIRSNVKSYASKPEIAVDAKGKKTIEEVGGHIPGALLANFKNLRGDRIINGKKVQYMIPEAADFEKIVRQTGVVAGKPIVLVPVGAEVADVDEALRLYWQFKVYGEDDVAVLNGGYMAWLLEGRPFELTTASAQGNWAVKGDRMAQFFASSDDVQAASQNKSATLVDARDLPTFHGLSKRDYVYDFGHIEGAQIFTPDLMFKNSGGALKFMNAETYRGLFKGQGIDPQKDVITYCNSGHLAAGPWFLMSEVVGNPRTRLYDGSMHEWTLEKRPVVNITNR